MYLTHHAYDEGQGGLWNGYPETAKEPAAYFVFTCNTCDEVLLYHYYADEVDFEDLFPFLCNKVKSMTWNEGEISRQLKLMWPQLWEDIHQYVPKTVRKIYLKALKNQGSPQIFAIEMRKAIEAICEERGIASKDDDGKYRTLGDKVKDLARIAMLPKPIVDIAHKIVKTGNDAAHSTVDSKIVPLIQNFFRVFINHVYVLPMQVQEWSSYQD